MRSAGVLERGGVFSVRVRLGDGTRPVVRMPWCKDRPSADARAEVIGRAVDDLLGAGLPWQVRDAVDAMAAAETPRELAGWVKIVARKVAAADKGPVVGETFEQFAERWTSGELARVYPDYVRKKGSVDDDVERLRRYILPHVRAVPVRLFTKEHAAVVMGAIPANKTPATRRHVAQIIYRIMGLAAHPAGLIPVSPLPRGWLPKLAKEGKAKQFLYPDEEAKLLACSAVPLEFRVLYGLLAREGMRVSEALALSWGDLDLARGALSLDENKTKDPRMWNMGAGTALALSAWRKRSARAPFAEIEDHGRMASRFRAHCRKAGLDRAKLYERSGTRQPVRLHDLRATFVTIALATGKTDTWVRDRTGHRSSEMLDRYRRLARTFVELQLGELAQLHEAIPEFAGIKVGSTDRSASESRSETSNKSEGAENGT